MYFLLGLFICPGGNEKVTEVKVTEDSRTEVTFMSRGATDPAESKDIGQGTVKRMHVETATLVREKSTLNFRVFK